MRKLFCAMVVALFVLVGRTIPAVESSSQIIYFPGKTLISVQNACFGSRLNMNFHFDPARRNVWSSTKGMLMDEKTEFTISTKWNGDGSIMAFAPCNFYPEYWYYVMDVNPNSFEQNGAHVRKGAKGGVEKDIIFNVNSKVISHFVPTTSLEDPDLKISIAPFFFIEVTVQNYTEQPQSGELFIRMKGAENINKNKTTSIIYFRNRSDGEGIRALAIREPVNWQNGEGMSLPFSLVPKGSVKKLFVYAGYNSGPAMIDKRNNTPLYFYYTKFFGSIDEVIDFAFSNESLIREKSSKFSSDIKTGNCDLDLIIGEAIHSYLANTWLLWDSQNKKPRFYVSEGNCQFLSTIDVAYETAMFEVEYIPWALKLQLEEWSEYIRKDQYGVFLQHDMGIGTEVRSHQAYSEEMKAEEIVNYVLMLFFYWKKTGDNDFLVSKMPLVRQFLSSLKNRDTDNNGIVDTEAGYTTFDFDWGDSALGIGCENINIGFKELMVFLWVDYAERQMEKELGKNVNSREYAFKIAETLKQTYHRYGRLPVASRDILKYGWGDNTIVNFEGLLYFILTNTTEDPFVGQFLDQLLSVIAPSHMVSLRECGIRLTSSKPVIWVSKALGAKIINDYFVTRGYYSDFEDSIIPGIKEMVEKMQLGWTDYDLGSPILYLYPRGVGPAVSIVNLIDDIVELNYRTWLHRPSDPGGKKFHFDLLRSGVFTPNQLTKNFRHSYEYVWDTPFVLNGIEWQGFVDYAFGYWFGHHQDRKGHDYYCNLITSGKRDDSWVFSEFYRAFVVIKAYRELLYREPDVGGFSCYLENMRDHGWSEQDVYRSIMDSPEYRQKHAL